MVSVFFALGLVVQAAVWLPHRLKELALTTTFAAVLSLIAAVTETSKNGQSDISLGLNAFSVFFVIAMYRHRNDILPTIHEGTAWVLTLALAVVLNQFLPWQTWLWLMALPLAVSGYAAFSKKELSDRLQVVTYAWFMVASAGIILFLLLRQIAPTVYSMQGPQPLEDALLGFSMLYVGVLLLQLLFLVPLRSKGESWTQRIDRWKQDVHMLAAKYDEKTQLGPIQAGILLVAAAALANGVFGVVSPVLFLGAVLTVCSLWKPHTPATS